MYIIKTFLHGPAIGIGMKKNLKSQILSSKTKMPINMKQMNKLK